MGRKLPSGDGACGYDPNKRLPQGSHADACNILNAYTTEFLDAVEAGELSMTLVEWRKWYNSRIGGA